jgi:flagellar protein FlgJ
MNISSRVISDGQLPRLPLAGVEPTDPNLRAARLNASLDPSSLEATPSTAAQAEVREAFHDFVGQTFFGQMIASMRSTQGDVPYFNGGRAEKIFQGQLDQVLAEELSEASASQIADPMFELFQLHRR